MEIIKKKLKTQTVIGIIKRMCAATLLLAVSAFAASEVQLVWTPPDDLDVTGYKIYYGIASGNYTNSIPTATTNLVITNLVLTYTYYFAATATNDLSEESIFSNEVVFYNELFQPAGIQMLRVSTAHFGNLYPYGGWGCPDTNVVQAATFGYIFGNDGSGIRYPCTNNLIHGLYYSGGQWNYTNNGVNSHATNQSTLPLGNYNFVLNGTPAISILCGP